MFAKGSQRPLGAFPVFLLLGVLDKLLGLLVDTEISQMDESLADILGLGVVLVSCKSSQSLLEHVNPQGVVASYHNVDPKIVLEVVDQVWIGDVLGH